MDNFEDFYEASKSDADKLSHKGNEVRVTRKGADITNTINKKHDKELYDSMGFKYDPKKFKADIDIDKAKPIKADRKRDIKASTRNKNNVVPDVGANPSFSKDADKKAVKKFKDSLKARDIDIDRSLEGVSSEAKKRILADRLKKGKAVPDSIKDKVVKKDNSKIKDLIHDNDTFKDKKYKDKNDPEFKRLINLYHTALDTRDYDEYKKATSELKSLFGIPKKATVQFDPDYSGGMGVHISNNRDKSHNKSTEVTKSSDKLYHSSNSGNVKALTPSFKTTDGQLPKFHDTPRVYFYKNKKGSRTGEGREDSNMYTPKTNPKFNTNDPELNNGAVFVHSKKEIPVKKESVETILNIYEAYFMNLITESEKDDLILLVESDNVEDEKEAKKKKYKKQLRLVISLLTILIIAVTAAKKKAEKDHGYDVTLKELRKCSIDAKKLLDDIDENTNIKEIFEKRAKILDRAQKLRYKCKDNPFIKITDAQDKKMGSIITIIACGGGDPDEFKWKSK